jgi:DNA mismatch repair protein MutS
MAIARSVVEFLHNRKEIAARTLFATHYHELTTLASVLPRVQNAHVAVREEGGEVVFEHRIVPGPSDRSYGIHVARLAGLPAPVIARAEHLLAELEQGGPERPQGYSENGHAAKLQASFLSGPSEVDSALERIDPDGLTPLEAMQQLYELKALARTAADGGSPA